jgi:anti-sigma factor RsiW
MKCKSAEKLIYLAAELSESEKSELNIHLQTCVDCHALYISATTMQTQIYSLASSEDVAIDTARLTNKVMSQLQRNEKTPVKLGWWESWLRLGLSGLSLLLVLGFYIEFNQAPEIKKDEVTSGSVVTHSGGAKILRDNEERASLIAIAEARVSRFK